MAEVKPVNPSSNPTPEPRKRVFDPSEDEADMRRLFKMCAALVVLHATIQVDGVDRIASCVAEAQASAEDLTERLFGKAS